jgi:hypothetical protein
MLNEDKISLMTRMAVYEKGKGKKDLNICNYFKSDYIGWQIIKSVICATIAFIIIIVLKLSYGFEDVMVNVYKTDLTAWGRDLFVRYIVFVLIYAGISLMISTLRYKKARKGLRVYYHELKKLSMMYRGNNE